MPKQTETTERELFERFADANGWDCEREPAVYSHTENRNGKYRDHSVQMAWEAWDERSGRI